MKKITKERKLFFISWVHIIISLFFILLIPVLVGLSRSTSNQYDNFKVAYNQTQLEKMEKEREPRIIFINKHTVGNKKVLASDILKLDHIDRYGKHQYILTNTFFGTPEKRISNIRDNVKTVSIGILIVSFIVIPISYLHQRKKIMKEGN